jgi:hypothetical protein
VRRSSSFAIVTAVVAAATAFAGPLTRRPSSQDTGIEQLGWISGCWVYTSPRVFIEELWTRPAGGTMLGVSRTLRRAPTGDSTMAWEFIRIHARGTDLVYAAQPHNQPAAEFVSERVSDSVVVFANPAHDYPQRIIYRRAGKDSLKARVEGTQGGRTRGSDFPYVRAACDSSAS